MKQSLMILTLLCSGLIQSSFAQNLSAFYTLSSKNADLGFAEGKDYPLTSAGKNNAIIHFDAVSRFPIDLKFLFTTEIKYADDVKFNISFGKDKKVDVVIEHNAERHGLNSQVYINGNKQQYQNFWVTSYGNKPDGTRQYAVSLRLNDNNIGVVYEGEMGSINVSENSPADTRNMSVEAISEGKTSVQVLVDTYDIPRLSCFAKSNLKIRSSADLSSKAIGSIPYGEAVHILDKNPRNADASHYYYGASTLGDMKVEGISSRMVKVMYKDKVGYAYGGYLLPLKPNKRKDKVSSQQGWNVNMFDDEVYRDNKLMYKKITFNFEDYHFSEMSPSQRPLLANILFPSLLTQDKIQEIIKTNKVHTIERRNAGLYKKCRVFVDKNEILEIVYTEHSTDFQTQISNISKQYIIASSLNMRASSDPKSDVLVKIPLGEAVKVVDNSGTFQILGGVRGKMIKVNYNGQEGYVFDAYLSPIAPVSLVKKPQYGVEETFYKTLHTDKFKKWKHDSVNKGSFDRFLEDGEWEQIWMVVPCRDKFQALKTLRVVCPFINDVAIQWNEAQGDYEIADNKSKRIEIATERNQTYITQYEDDEMIEGTAILIEQIDENLFKVTLVMITPGC